MNSKIKKIISVVSAFCMIGNAAYFNSSQFSASAASKCIVENLDRGISAVNTGSGMMISWRFLAGDSDSVVFKLDVYKRQI